MIVKQHLFAFLDVTRLEIYQLKENGAHIDHDRRRKVRTVKLATLFFLFMFRALTFCFVLADCINRLFAYCKGSNFKIHIWALFG